MNTKTKLGIFFLALFLSNIVTYTIAQSFTLPDIKLEWLPFDARYTIDNYNGYTWATKYDGSVNFNSTSSATIMQQALNDLTINRVWFEKIIIKGNYTLNNATALPIKIPDYTEVEINAKIFLANNMNKNIFEGQSNHPKHIYLHGGVIDGNKNNQQAWSSDAIKFYSVDTSYDAYNTIENVEFYNVENLAIDIYGSTHNKILNNKFISCDNGILIFSSEGAIITGNSFYSNGYSIILNSAQGFMISNNIFNYGGTTFYFLVAPSLPKFNGIIESNIGNPYASFCDIGAGSYNPLGYVDTTYNLLSIRNNFFTDGDDGSYIYPFQQKIVNPFKTIGSSNTISAWGDSASPSNNINYTAYGFDFLVRVNNTLGLDNITIYDRQGNIVVGGLVALTSYYLPIGFSINFSYSDSAPQTFVFPVS